MEFLKRVLSLGKNKCYEEGIELYNDHKYRLAIEKFQEIIKKKSPTTSPYFRLSHLYCGKAHHDLGILLFAMGNFSRAAKEFEKALQFDPRQVEIWEYLGICYNNIGKFEKSANAFKNVLKQEPNHLSSKLKLGIAFHNLEMWNKAILTCQEILKIHPKYADVHFHLGLTYLGQGNAPMAASAFEKALEINPKYRDARIKLGITHTYLGNLEEALSHLSSVLNDFPDYADLHYYMGIIHSSRDEPKKAVSFFRRSLEINPSFIDARFRLGIVLCRVERYNEALDELEEAHRLDPGNRNLRTVLKVLRKMIREPEQGPQEVSRMLQWILGDKEMISRSIRQSNKHIQIIPNFSELLSTVKSFPDEDISIYEGVIPLIKDTISENPDYPDFYSSLGSLYFKVRRFEQAENAFKKALDINPEYLQARFNLFRTFKAKGELEAALKEGQYLFEKGLPYPDFYCSLGEIYISFKMFDKAEAILQSTLKKKPRYARAHLILAQFYENMGDKDKAISLLLKCLDSNPSKERELDAREALLRLRG